MFYAVVELRIREFKVPELDNVSTIRVVVSHPAAGVVSTVNYDMKNAEAHPTLNHLCSDIESEINLELHSQNILEYTCFEIDPDKCVLLFDHLADCIKYHIKQL